MLKKTGIIVATTAAGLLVLSPLAFAGPAVVNADNQSVNCEFAAAADADNNASSSSLVDVALIDVVAGAAVNAIVQAPILSCNNVDVEDVLDFDSNNTTTTVNR